MTASEATLLAAIIAAAVASAGLLWSVASFLISNHNAKTASARSQWQSRFESAHRLALSEDPKQAQAGALLMKSLSEEKWVTDTDRATTASVLLSLPEEESEPEKVREVLSAMQSKTVAAALAKVPPGPKGRFEVWRDEAGQYQWRLISGAGEELALSPTGYATTNDALRAVKQFRRR